MARTPRDRLGLQLDKLDDLDAETADRLREFADVLDAAKPDVTATDRNGDRFECEARTVELYVRNCRLLAERGVDLLDASAADVNAKLAEMYDDGDGLKANTMIGYQAAARALYAAFDLGVDPEAVDTYSPDPTPRHDEQDLFTEDEVFAMRKAVGRTRNPIRDRAFLELLIFTGQRLTALLTLRLEDVDLENGSIYLNDQVDGLKGALRRGRRRPIFGARKYVREWVQTHPVGEGWLFVGDPSNPNTVEGEYWNENAARDMLRRVGEWADVDKPVNPHNFRHYGATVLRRDYDLAWDEINALFGVVKGSSLPETTYSHVDDNDLMRNIEAAMGFDDGEDRNRFTPVVCPTCDEVLKSDWRKCPACNEEFAPGADDGTAELEWMADRVPVSANSFKRIVGRAVEKELAENHSDSS